MATTWIVAADTSRARILQVMDRDQRLAEVEDFTGPDAKRVGDYLEGACGAQRFDRLHLVGPQDFLCRLMDELPVEVRKLVRVRVTTDSSGLSARDIERTYFKAA